MRLNDAYVERFGTWKNLTLPADSGISVFFGPNEAGKTTLMRFLRGMLYGFQTDVEANSGGSLGVLHDGQELRLERRTNAAAEQHVAVTGWNRISPIEETLHELLSDVTSDVYSNVFAIGLSELQELATLNGDAIADAIYGVSLAPEGRKLLNAIHAADERRRELFDAEAHRGQLTELLDLEGDLNAEIQSFSGQRDEYERLCARRKSLANNVDDMNARKNGMVAQLRGHRFMEHVWGPWKQVREYRETLARLPDASRFPDDGLERLAKWNEQIASERRCRNVLKEEAKALRNRADAFTIDMPLLRHAAKIQVLAAERDRIERVLADKHECEETVLRLDEQQAQTLADLGGDWTAERLSAVDTSPDAQFHLLDAARRYQSALVQRGRLRRIYKRLSGTYRKQRAKSAARDRQLGGKLPEEALVDAKRSLAQNENRLQLDREEAELAHRAELIGRELAIVEPKEIMPRWFFWVLVFFAIAGGLVCAAGIVSGLTGNAWAGFILALVGLCGIGVARGLNAQSRGSNRENVERLRTELHRAEHRLNEIQHAKPESPAGEDDEDALPATTAEAVSNEQLAQRIVELKAAVSIEKRQQTRRRRLAELRTRIPRRQQAVTESRRVWFEALTRTGLPENVKLDTSFDLWQTVCEAVETHRSLQKATSQLAATSRVAEEYRERVVALGREIGDEVAGNADLLEIVDHWLSRRDEAKTARVERRKLLREIHVRRKEAARYAKQIYRIEQQRLALFARAGASDEDEFERLAGSLKQRAEIVELLGMAEEELREAAATEPKLAVVEEDLEAFDATGNVECIRMLELEIGEIESDLQAAYEDLGRVKQSIEELASDRRLTKLRYEQARVRESIKQTMEEWFGIQLAEHGLNAVRNQYERGRQPKVLATAAEYFQRLTGGQYRNLWTPLGRRVLCVDDEQGRTRTVEQLSGGTREQLFLAIRLAMIDQFRERGVELPIVLDDVLVNFDEARTDSAIATLIEAARRGQQILFFTCHRHLAERFAEQGGTVINLPDFAGAREERRAG